MVGKMSILAGFVLLVCVTASAAQDEFARVEVQGVLQHDFENKRTTVSAGGRSFDVNFGENRELARAAERFDRQLVLISGNLAFERGGDGCSMPVIDANRILGVREKTVRYEKEVIRERPPERVIIQEKDDPLFKLGPLEIND